MTEPRAPIGVDFDNTIVRYDALFHRLALEQELIGPDVAATKELVRDTLRAAGREDDWTELQGLVYGARIEEAEAFPGAVEFLGRCLAEETPVAIVSHKTLRPYRGPAYDLHDAARRWLASRGLEEVRASFETTKEAKLARIGTEGCSVFIDDLPELLLEPAFPDGVERILFDPNASAAAPAGLRRAASWAQLEQELL